MRVLGPASKLTVDGVNCPPGCDVLNAASTPLVRIGLNAMSKMALAWPAVTGSERASLIGPFAAPPRPQPLALPIVAVLLTTVIVPLAALYGVPVTLPLVPVVAGTSTGLPPFR